MSTHPSLHGFTILADKAMPVGHMSAPVEPSPGTKGKKTHTFDWDDDLDCAEATPPSDEPKRSHMVSQNSVLYDPASPAFAAPTFELAFRPMLIPVSRRPPIQAGGRRYSITDSGDLEEAPIECWEKFRGEPSKHVLLCGHVVNTKYGVPCGSSCKTSSSAERKAPGPKVDCSTCIRSRQRAAGIFIPKPKRKPTKRAIDDDGLFIPEVEGSETKRRFMLPGDRSAAFTASQPPALSPPPATTAAEDREEQELIELNAEIAKDKSLQYIIASSMGAFGRQRSKLHPGYALRAERDAEAAVKALPREIARLRTDGTDALRFKLARKQTYAASNIAADIGERKGEVPHSFGRTKTTGKPSVRVQHAGFHSISRVDYNRMLYDENGVMTVEEAANVSIAQQDQLDVDDDIPDDGVVVNSRGVRPGAGYFDGKCVCVCGGKKDEALSKCKECEDWFHASCMGDPAFERCTACQIRRDERENLFTNMLIKQRKKYGKKDLAPAHADTGNRRSKRIEKAKSLRGGAKDNEGTAGDAMELD